MEEITSPPKFVLGILMRVCPPDLYEGIEGDLVEQFDADVKKAGLKKAKRKFIFNAIRFLHPSIMIRNRFSFDLINMMMLGNYFKVAVRNIQKRKLYSFINAFGLSIGIAFCMLIYLFIMDEKNFDQFHENSANIYRIEEKSFDTWKHDSADPYRKSAWIQTGLKQVLKDELPEVVKATRYNNGETAVFRYGEKVFTESLTYVDDDFFSMFSFKLLKGNPDELFKNKSDIVITPEIAEKYFGDEDPIGKTVQIGLEKEISFIVAAIIEPHPSNSSFQYEILLPQENRWGYERNMAQWGNFNTPTFVQLRPDVDLVSFKTNLEKLTDKYMGDKLKEWREESTVPIPAEAKMMEYQFTPLPDWHLKTEIDWDKVSDPKYSMILGGIAILILLIAGQH